MDSEGGIFLFVPIAISFSDPFLRIFQAIRHDIHRLFTNFLLRLNKEGNGKTCV